MKAPRKGTAEFAEAQRQFFEVLARAAEEESKKVVAGVLGLKAGALMGNVSKPFGCEDLEFILYEDQRVAWFCGRIGCLCTPCREDMEGTYPDYCPPSDALERSLYLPDYEEEDI